VPPTQSAALTPDQQRAMSDLVASLRTLVTDTSASYSAVNGTVLVKASDSTQEQVSAILAELRKAHEQRGEVVRARSGK
jgi:hypothetical protein